MAKSSTVCRYGLLVNACTKSSKPQAPSQGKAERYKLGASRLNVCRVWHGNPAWRGASSETASCIIQLGALTAQRQPTPFKIWREVVLFPPYFFLGAVCTPCCGGTSIPPQCWRHDSTICLARRGFVWVARLRGVSLSFCQRPFVRATVGAWVCLFQAPLVQLIFSAVLAAFLCTQLH